MINSLPTNYTKIERERVCVWIMKPRTGILMVDSVTGDVYEIPIQSVQQTDNYALVNTADFFSISELGNFPDSFFEQLKADNEMEPPIHNSSLVALRLCTGMTPTISVLSRSNTDASWAWGVKVLVSSSLTPLKTMESGFILLFSQARAFNVHIERIEKMRLRTARHSGQIAVVATSVDAYEPTLGYSSVHRMGMPIGPMDVLGARCVNHWELTTNEWIFAGLFRPQLLIRPPLLITPSPFEPNVTFTENSQLVLLRERATTRRDKAVAYARRIRWGQLPTELLRHIFTLRIADSLAHETPDLASETIRTLASVSKGGLVCTVTFLRCATAASCGDSETLGELVNAHAPARIGDIARSLQSTVQISAMLISLKNDPLGAKVGSSEVDSLVNYHYQHVSFEWGCRRRAQRSILFDWRWFLAERREHYKLVSGVKGFHSITSPLHVEELVRRILET